MQSRIIVMTCTPATNEIGIFVYLYRFQSVHKTLRCQDMN